jgi:hypothetical protein
LAKLLFVASGSLQMITLDYVTFQCMVADDADDVKTTVIDKARQAGNTDIPALFSTSSILQAGSPPFIDKHHPASPTHCTPPS